MAHDEHGNWIGLGDGDTGPGVARLQHRLLHAYPTYSRAEQLGVTESGVYTPATKAAVINICRHINDLPDHLKPPAARGHTLRTDGIADWRVQTALGAVIPAGGNAPPSKRFIQQGIAYPAMGFLTPDPQVSYVESRDAGVAELLRLALPDPRPKVFIGYSQGADVATHVLHRWPAERRDEIEMVVTFGSPGRAPGPTLFGTDFHGAGISGVYTPEWAREKTWDFILDGDWYPAARGLLPLLYELLTRMELSLEFAMFLVQRLSTAAGQLLLGVQPSDQPGAGALAPIAPMVLGRGGNVLGVTSIFALLPQLIWLLVDAITFVHTNAHVRYHDLPMPKWGGLTGVDRAAHLITEHVDSAVVYTIPGTWAGWNDGPPAWTAWKLP